MYYVCRAMCAKKISPRELAGAGAEVEAVMIDDVVRGEGGEHEGAPVLAGGWRGRLALAVEGADRAGDIWLAGG